MAWYECVQPVSARDLRQLKEALMLDITKLRADLTALQQKETTAEATETADLAKVSQTIAGLKAQIATGETVTQADLDALDTQVQQVGTGIDTIVSGLDSAANQ